MHHLLLLLLLQEGAEVVLVAFHLVLTQFGTWSSKNISIYTQQHVRLVHIMPLLLWQTCPHVTYTYTLPPYPHSEAC